jgi:hypothetical protein
MEEKNKAKLITTYFNELDSAFKKLSHKKEGQLSNLPNYVFNKKNIEIFKLNNLDYYFIRAHADRKLKKDTVTLGNIKSNEELNTQSSPMRFDFDFKNPKKDYTVLATYLDVRELDNFNSLPVLEYCIFGIVPGDKFGNLFSKDEAKKRSLQEWNDFNDMENVLDKNYSFIHNLKKIFDKLELILDDPSFIERKLHRYINKHAMYILPAFTKCYYEHDLYLDQQKRTADFILERETGLPSMLIELENASKKVFKKNDELAQYANHAGEQIKEWIKFIEQNSDNVKGDMDFLTGPKEKMIIIGRGLACLDAMKDQKFNGQIVWTYDLLIKEAKNRWNNIIMDQCKTVGIDQPNLL